MKAEVQAPAGIEQTRTSASRSAWGIAVGAVFVLIFFLMLTGKVFAKPSIYWGTLLFFAILFSVVWGRVYWQSSGRQWPPTMGEYLISLVVIVAPLTWCTSTLAIRAAHKLLPSEERVMSFVVTSRGTYSSSKGKGCFYFAELPGFLNNSVCGYSRYFLAVVRMGDVFSYRTVASPVGYQLEELVEVKREGELVYRRKGY